MAVPVPVLGARDLAGAHQLVAHLTAEQHQTAQDVDAAVTVAKLWRAWVLTFHWLYSSTKTQDLLFVFYSIERPCKVVSRSEGNICIYTTWSPQGTIRQPTHLLVVKVYESFRPSEHGELFIPVPILITALEFLILIAFFGIP